MRLLILGGTRFLGRAIVEEAVGRGWDVTTFSRGQAGAAPPGVEVLRGDRTQAADLGPLTEREWDAVIDTSALAPGHVAASAAALAGRVGHYTYVSSLSVYADFPRQPVTEDSALVEGAADATGSVEELGYPALKAGSERAVSQAMPGHCLIARPGLVVGPHEYTGRLTWWLARLAAGGDVLAPGEPARATRVTDARDLAAWLADNTRRKIPGTVNVPGPEGQTLGAVLAACAQVTEPDRKSEASLRWVGDEALATAGVRPWTELPLWAPDTPEWAGVWRASGDRALRTGMRYRPVKDTIRDTWVWLRQRLTAGDGQAAPRAAGIGLDPAREREILAAG